MKSIQFRDNLYKQWKLINPESQEYLRAKLNLKVYNGILNRNIRLAKKDYYFKQFEKHRCDIRKTWDTLKNILNKLKSKSVHPKMFLIDGHQVTNMTSIGNKFNEYFISVGSNLANAIDTRGKLAYTSYLGAPSITTFNFTCTNSDEVRILINNLKPKQSAGHDSMSSKLLKNVGHIIAPTLSVIINQSFVYWDFSKPIKDCQSYPSVQERGRNLDWKLQTYIITILDIQSVWKSSIQSIISIPGYW